ncbi:MAG: hypothetical protein Rsou_0502 [Candidatus Ruthia sp. Asou_11_S2]|nr:hypothetical protein [Candidatus Ruthia sp. Asou_11_S2]
MAYLANQPIAIANKKVLLLLDNYGPKNRNSLNICDATQGFSFFVQHSELYAIRKAHPKRDIYGFWQLLFLSKQIELSKDSGFFVVYKENSSTDGFFTYYNRVKSEFVTGIVINNAIGAFAQDLSTASIVRPNIELINFPEAILLPVEKQLLKQKLYQKVAL